MAAGCRPGRAADEGTVRRIGALRLRDRGDLTGVVVGLEVASLPRLELDVVIDDGTGLLVACFFGRTAIPGLSVGRRVHVSGTLTRYRGRARMLNPAYELLVDCGGPSSQSS
jgi:RecG-like helicase